MIDLEKFIEIEKYLAEQRGGFELFALFLREDALDKWDLLVKSPWTDSNKGEALRMIAKTLQERLNKTELSSLSRVIVIEDNNPALSAILSAVQVEHAKAEVKNSNFFGLVIKHAYIITSKRLVQQ